MRQENTGPARSAIGSAIGTALGDCYQRIYDWYVEHATLLDLDVVDDFPRQGDQMRLPPEYRERSKRLIEHLPHRDAASVAEQRVTMHEVRTGLLEWAYGAANGDLTNADFASAGLEQSGGSISSPDFDALRATPLWQYSTIFYNSRPETPDRPPTSSASEGAGHDPAPEPDVASDVAGYQFTTGARAIMERAGHFAASGESPAPMSTSLMFFALVELGTATGEPAWAADFLTKYLVEYSDGYPAMRDDYFAGRGLDLTAKSGEPDDITPNTRATLDLAQIIAKRTTGSPEIGARHLAAALLTDSATAKRPQARLERLGIDVPSLRDRLYRWLHGFGDNDAAWREVLLTAGPIARRMTDFRADDARGPDLLDIEQDVVALATVIAARAVSPPLSIGLFGDWGSGKTFFMRQLKALVADLSAEARAEPVMQRDLPFYKRIVQIEFNAWHYVEGNLWASLVEHIFSNLHLPDDNRRTKVEEMQKHWIEKLGFAESKSADAEARQRSVQQRVQSAEREVTERRLAYEAKKAELQSLSAKSAARDFDLSGAGAVLQKMLAPLGVRPATDAALDLESALRQARDVLGRGNRILTPLLHAPDRGPRVRSLLVILFGGIATAALVTVGLVALGQETVARIYGLVVGAAATIAVGARWVRDQARWVAARLDDIETAQRAYDDNLRAELSDKAGAIKSAEQALADERQEIVAAQQRVDEAHRQRDSIHKELEEVTSAHLLARFIEDRAASVDYRKHLGVLALVRDDFEQLSELIEHENWRLSPDGPDHSRFSTAAGSPLPRFDSLEDENREASVRINRIVLYIDDLDRCPPAKVVEVLQAVHLLLAFPLFVVVVGVDARWVSRSLESRYRELLKGGFSDAAGDLTNMFGVARSEDYLEKIFQIPLWLRPMTTPDVQRMVRGLVRTAWSNRLSGRLDTGSSANSVAQAWVAGAAGGLAAAASDAGDADRRASPPRAPGGVVQPASDRPPLRGIPNVESLDILDDELTAISDLSPLLGRSPRALKRFVNIYRLIKAGFSANEFREFMRPQKRGLSDYQKVLFLLAVDTGLPRVSRILFDVLLAGPNNDTDRRRGVDWLLGDTEHRVVLAAKNSPQDASLMKEWAILRPWIEGRMRDEKSVAALDQLATWVPLVSKFSFQAGAEARAFARL